MTSGAVSCETRVAPLAWRVRSRRPPVECVVARVPFGAWRLFARHHYLTAELNHNVRCFGLWANGQLASFAAMMHRPHPRVRDIEGCSRLVTLPDWQGLGLALALIERVGAAYKAVGKRARTYPAHPALVRAFDRSPAWRLVQPPGEFRRVHREKSTLHRHDREGGLGGRPCAVFEFAGDAMDRGAAERFIEGVK